MKKNEGISRRKFISGASSLAMMTALPGFAQSPPSNKALKLAESHRNELLTLLNDMIRVRSLSGESAADAQKIVKKYLEELPYRIEESNDQPSRYKDHPEFMPPSTAGDGPFTNVVGWPTKNMGKRQFAMFAHIDTEAVYEGWQTDPYEPILEGNKLYGLGTSDDKAGVAAMLVAAAALSKSGEALPVVMSLHGKGGGSRGSLPIFERISKTDHGLGAVLYVHPAETGRGLEDIKNAVQGIVDLEMTVEGWRGEQMEINSIDSAEWEEGGNAVETSWQILDHLRNTVFRNVLVNIGMLNGGDRIGSVADKATVTFRLKFEGTNTWADLVGRARQAIDAYIKALPASDKGYKVELKIIGYRTNPGTASWEAPVSKVLRQSILDITGRAPDAYPNHYAGDIRYPIRLLNVPAYGIGSLGGNFYGSNEWVDVDDLVKLVAVCIQTISGWQKM
ncbi:MAG: M20 family metallopeptidase [Cyclobacteriaceae bacterium]|nr:M20 family metallopeptidase [Cyclobacteriaceae bacterium]